MNTNELWQAVLGDLELTLSKPSFMTWFKNTSIASCEGDRVVISVPSTFVKAWIEKKYNTAILKCLQKTESDKIRSIVYKVEQRAVQAEAFKTMQYGGADVYTMTQENPLYSAKKETVSDGRLNPKYTFHTFVVGKGNELAHAAAVAVVENPGTKYNPLFIYGGVGLGKTHLAQAIGNELLKQNRGAKVMYVTCEKFTNDFINAVKTGVGKEFKETYRGVDILLIDDVQFFSGHDGTQEEFFHTFNTLHQINKQVVLTSDRPPQMIPALEHRLQTRFQMGMMADIASPDFETRVAIIETKCKERNYDITPEISRYIATIIQSNVRELEGALNKVIAYNQFKNTRPTLESTKSLLSGFGPQRKNITARQIMQTVAQFYDVSINDITGKCREKRLAFPRQIIMYLMREEMSASYPMIGNEIGGRDHTTAIHAYEKISKEAEHDQKVRQDIDNIKQRMYAN